LNLPEIKPSGFDYGNIIEESMRGVPVTAVMGD
jgi:hypothetical protein